MYKATVIETFIATPSDIVQERAFIREIINEWNIVNSKTRNVILKDLGWENDIYSSFSDGRPQESINKQILEDADLLIGVFWTRVGTPTGDYISGSVEEITKHINAHKPVLLFFSDMPVRLDSVDQNQYQKLLDFKKWCQEIGIYNSYDNPEDFVKIFTRQLGLVMNSEKKILDLIGSPDRVEYYENEYRNTIKLSDNAKQLLKEISLDRSGQLIAIMTLGGYNVQTNGKSFGSKRNDARAKAEIDSAIEELESLNLIRSNPKREIFTINAKGYEIADEITLKNYFEINE